MLDGKPKRLYGLVVLSRCVFVGLFIKLFLFVDSIFVLWLSFVGFFGGFYASFLRYQHGLPKDAI